MTPALTELRALLERVEGATDRLLSADDSNMLWDITDGYGAGDDGRYDTTIDAAVAFSQAVLPGWMIVEMGQDPLHGLWFCCLYNIDTKTAAESSELDTLSSAIIAATLRAMIAESEVKNAESEVKNAE